MRKNFYGAAVLAVFLWALVVFAGTNEASAGVQFNVYVGPPVITVPAPPEVVLIPGSQVYFVPQPGIDIFFYGGWWWSPRGDRWYRSRAYNGPWVIIGPRYVPGPVLGIPRDYRGRFERERHIPYGQWKKERGVRGRHAYGRDRQERETHERGGEHREREERR